MKESHRHALRNSGFFLFCIKAQCEMRESSGCPFCLDNTGSKLAYWSV